MHYLIYKITNRLNNKIYVGKHKTENKDDDYLGSGILIERAIAKHGKENFVKEILFELPDEDTMNQKEADIVDEDFVSRDDTYNLKLGGIGGWDFINENGLNAQSKSELSANGKKGAGTGNQIKQSLWETDTEWRNAYREKMSMAQRIRFSIGRGAFTGRKHTPETREKMRVAKVGVFDGRKNPSFGKHWITNGVENKLSDTIPAGWRRGRISHTGSVTKR